jgi:hypothetical protein
MFRKMLAAPGQRSATPEDKPGFIRIGLGVPEGVVAHEGWASGLYAALLQVARQRA